MPPLFFLIGIVAFIFVYAYWCVREVKNNCMKFTMGVIGGVVIGGAIISVILESTNDTQTDSGFWMEYAKMQLIDAEQNKPILFTNEEGK